MSVIFQSLCRDNGGTQYLEMKYRDDGIGSGLDIYVIGSPPSVHKSSSGKFIQLDFESLDIDGITEFIKFLGNVKQRMEAEARKRHQDKTYMTLSDDVVIDVANLENLS